MHVALDVRSLQPSFPGIGRYVSNLARHLVSNPSGNQELTLIGHQSAFGRLHLNASPSCRFQDMRSGIHSPWQALEIPRRISRLSVDLLHLPYLSMPIQPGIPLVVTIHDLIPVRLPKQVSWRARTFFPILLRWMLPRIQRIIVPSHYSREDFLKWARYPDSRISVIPHAAAAQFHDVAGGEVARVRAKFGLASYWLSLSSNREHKNLERLEEAYRAADIRTPLVIAGSGQKCRPDPEGTPIRRLGEIDERDLPGLYAGAQLLVFPSLYEGFGFPVVEALAAGTPVACSGNTALPEIAGDAACYFDPRDTRDIKTCLEHLEDHPDRLQELRQRARERARLFSWGDTATRTREVYRQVAALK